MHKLKSFIFLVFIIQLCHAQFNDLRINRYSIDDGLPFNKITCLKQDSRGYIWIGTENGLSCFNGIDFVNFYNQKNNQASLPSNIITALAEDTCGNIWLSTYNGISRYNPHNRTFKKYAVNSSVNFATRLNSIGRLIDCNGSLFAMNENALWKYNYSRDKLEQVFPQQIKELADSIHDFLNLYFDSRHRLWILSKSNFALFDLQNGTYKCFGLKNKAVYFSDAIEDSRHNLYISSLTDGLFYLDTKTEQLEIVVSYTINSDHDASFLRNLAFQNSYSNKLLMSGNFFGYFEYNIETNELKKHVFNEIFYNPILETSTRFIMKDKQGNVWVASNNGLYKADNYKSDILNFKTDRILLKPDSNITSCVMLNDSVYWLGVNYTKLVEWNLKTNNTKLIEIKDQRNKNVKINTINDMMLRNGEMWITDVKFVASYNFKSGKWKKYSVEFVPKKVSVEEVCLGILFDKRNQLWMNSNLGIYKLKTDTFEEVFLNEKNNPLHIKLSPHFRELICDRNGFIWALRAYNWERGKICVTKINPESLDALSYFNIVGDSASLPSDNDFYDIQIDQFNTVYIASTENLITFNANEPMPEFVTPEYNSNQNQFGSIHKIELTGNHIWCYTSMGIFTYDIILRKVLKSYTARDGLPQEPGQVYFFNSFFNDRVLFAKRNFLYLIHPQIKNQTIQKPEVFITGITFKEFEYKDYQCDSLFAPYLSKVDLKPGINDVTFIYSSMNYSDIRNDRYSYILQHFEKQWSLPSANNKAVFDNLPPGNYIFSVKVRNNQGIWSKPLSIPLIVEPFYYQTLWFKILLAFIAAGMIFGAFIYRIRMIQKEVAQKLVFNKQLSEKEMQALRAQMNPHFVFNALNSINRYIIRSDKETASEYLIKFSKLMRLILENSKSSSIPLQDELEALRLYVEMELLRFDNKFEFKIEVDDDIDKSKTFIAPMIFQPFIENSIWHGLMNKKDRGLIQLSIKKLDGNKLFCCIEDNGVGREKSSLMKTEKDRTRKSFGMQITRDRILAISDDKKSFSIIDLVDSNNNPCGTRVEIILNYETES